MNYALDLLDAVTAEDPSAVLPIVQQAAEDGHHLVISRWIEQQTESAKKIGDLQLGAEDGSFVNAMLSLAARSDGKIGDPSAVAFGRWAEAALSSKPQRYSELLSWCVQSTRPSLDAAGHELLALGAVALSASKPDDGDTAFDLAGAKMGLTERKATLVARALSHQHPLARELVSKASTAKTPWPIVSEVGVDGVFYPVNAASYAIILGDPKMLREVCKATNADEHQMGIGLSEAIAFSMNSGLTKNCTPEVAQCIAICIAQGADLDHANIGQRMTDERVTIAQEVSDFEYRGDLSYRMSALFISARTGSDSLIALSRLANEYKLDLNGPVTEGGNRASLLHYAAASGSPILVSGLIKLGADEGAIDSKGLTPAAWSHIYARTQVQPLFDAERVVREAHSFEQVRVESLPVFDENAQSWNPNDVPWQAEENDIPLESAEGEFDSEYFPESINSPNVRSPSSHSLPNTKKVAPGLGRDEVAPSASGAQASLGAALFLRLKSSQANIAAKAVSKDEDREAVARAELAESAGSRMAFRARP